MSYCMTREFLAALPAGTKIAHRCVTTAPVNPASLRWEYVGSEISNEFEWPYPFTMTQDLAEAVPVGTQVWLSNPKYHGYWLKSNKEWTYSERWRYSVELTTSTQEWVRSVCQDYLVSNIVLPDEVHTSAVTTPSIPECPFVLTVDVANILPNGAMITFNKETVSWRKTENGWTSDSFSYWPAYLLVGRLQTEFKVTSVWLPSSAYTTNCIKPKEPNLQWTPKEDPSKYSAGRDWSCNCALSRVTFDAHVSGAVEKELRAKLEHEKNCRSRYREENCAAFAISHVRKQPAVQQKTEQKIEKEFLDDLLCEDV